MFHFPFIYLFLRTILVLGLFSCLFFCVFTICVFLWTGCFFVCVFVLSSYSLLRQIWVENIFIIYIFIKQQKTFVNNFERVTILFELSKHFFPTIFWDYSTNIDIALMHLFKTKQHHMLLEKSSGFENNICTCSWQPLLN